jgi:hypothetical protein
VEELYNIDFVNEVLYLGSKIKIGKWNYIKVKRFCMTKKKTSR